MSERPIEEYSLPYLWQRIAELERYESLVKASPNELHVRITELHKCIAELEELCEIYVPEKILRQMKENEND